VGNSQRPVGLDNDSFLRATLASLAVMSVSESRVESCIRSVGGGLVGLVGLGVASLAIFIIVGEVVLGCMNMSCPIRI